MLNTQFIQRAQKVTSFNLVAGDFVTLEYKKEIQHLFSTHFFPEFDDSELEDGVDMHRLNKSIDKLRTENLDMLKALHNYPLKGVGPGEALLYYLINDGHLGGGSSAGLDLVTKHAGYEVKAVNVTSNGYASNLRMGATFSVAHIMQQIQQLKEDILGKKASEVNSSDIKVIQGAEPAKWLSVSRNFKQLAYDNYFKHHKVIFMHNLTKKNIGRIAAVQNVTYDDIEIERVTNGTVKPKIKLN